MRSNVKLNTVIIVPLLRCLILAIEIFIFKCLLPLDIHKHNIAMTFTAKALPLTGKNDINNTK